MRYDGLYLAGVGSYLPRAVSALDAVEAGHYDDGEQLDSGQQEVTVAGDDESPPEMAVRAAREALDRCGHPAGDVSLLLYAVTTHHGPDGWNAPCYLQHEVLGGAGVAFEVGQQSNGALAAVDLAAAFLLAAPERTAAMVVAADRFPAPWWDRWRTGWGFVFADGASAAVLSRRGGFARVRSSVTVTDAGLEGMHRGDLPFAPTDAQRYPVDFRARSLDFAQALDFADSGKRMAEGMREAVERAVAEARVDLAAVTHVVVPGFGRQLLARECLEPLGLAAERTTWSWSAHVGHLGAADQFAALAHLADAGRLAPGETVALLGVGGGFNWTCVVLDIVDRPAWSA